MKNRSLITAIVTGIVGILLIAFEGRGDLLTWIVILMGVMFIVPGVYVLLSQLFGSAATRSTTSIVASVGCVALGVILCVIPGVFVSLLIYLFAFALIFAGVAEIASLSDFKMPMAYYIIPAVMVITGVVMIFAGSNRDASVIVLITGIALVLYAINSIAEYCKLRKLAQ